MIIFKLDDLIWQKKTTSKIVADETGLGATTISRLRNGKNGYVSLKTLDKLCKYFHCKITDIIEYIDD